MTDNSRERIKFACKELEDALALFGANEKEPSPSAPAAVVTSPTHKNQQAKIAEIKRQLCQIREQLDSLSQ
jgi:hypothetical protein